MSKALAARQRAKEKRLEAELAAFDAYEQNIHYFGLLIDDPEVTELTERLQEVLLRKRTTAVDNLTSYRESLQVESPDNNGEDS